ncbi:MAG TPA: hypothetical protein VGT06_02280 [Candidatus Methylomirabilis sp.]|nr:hypothetical protein [Candidatus Methylomirabilis sp.]
MLDAVLLERQGVVTATILTSEFLEAGRQHARNYGMPDLPLIPIAHPVANVGPEALRKKTEAVFPEVLEALLRGAAGPATSTTTDPPA